jgi:molybdopterin converting factor small subunit
MAYVVTVKLFGYLERLTREREARVEVDEGATVLDLVRTLADRYGPEFSSAVFRAPGQVHTHLRVFLDEAEVGLGEPLARDGRRAAEATVLVIPGFEGGSR